MFCDSCGNAIQPGQNHCPRCGKAILGPVRAGSGRVARHRQMLGIMWIAYSALSLLCAMVIFILVHGYMHLRIGAPALPTSLRPLLAFVAMLLLVKAVAGIIAGIGLLQYQSWARVLTLVVAVLSLLRIPIGTALGVYTLWVLLAPNADEEFRAMAKTAGA